MIFGARSGGWLGHLAVSLCQKKASQFDFKSTDLTYVIMKVVESGVRSFADVRLFWPSIPWHSCRLGRVHSTLEATNTSERGTWTTVLGESYHITVSGLILLPKPILLRWLRASLQNLLKTSQRRPSCCMGGWYRHMWSPPRITHDREQLVSCGILRVCIRFTSSAIAMTVAFEFIQCQRRGKVIGA